MPGGHEGGGGGGHCQQERSLTSEWTQEVLCNRSGGCAQGVTQSTEAYALGQASALDVPECLALGLERGGQVEVGRRSTSSHAVLGATASAVSLPFPATSRDPACLSLREHLLCVQGWGSPGREQQLLACLRAGASA